MSIPSSQRPAIAGLAQMAPEIFEALADQVAAAGPSSAAVGLIRQLKPPSTEVARVWTLALVTLVSLRLLVDQQDIPEEVIAAAISAEAARLKLVSDPRHVTTLQERVGKLLLLRPIILTAKAFDLATEYEHPLHDARILTDIRTIFEPREQESPSSAAALIMHVLKLRDLGGNEYYTSFTYSHLKDLKATIQRALLKEEELRARLAKAEVQCLVEDNRGETGDESGDTGESS